MLHLKCVGCRLRLASSGAPDGGVGERCPGCGSLLEPVARLAEIVGFQAISASGPRPIASEGHRRLARRVRELRALEQAAKARAEQKAWRWLDADGSFSPETVAAAMAAHGRTPTR
jgi:hypothetical protein